VDLRPASRALRRCLLSAEDVARLVDGAKPFLMVTDPPYGVIRPAMEGASRSGRSGKWARVRKRSPSRLERCVQAFTGDVALFWHAGVHSAE